MRRKKKQQETTIGNAKQENSAEQRKARGVNERQESIAIIQTDETRKHEDAVKRKKMQRKSRRGKKR